MKRISISSIVLMVFGGHVNAQSSITVFGVVDAAISRVQSGGGGHRTGLASGSNLGSRLGFRGTEDLGGGMGASFWLEAPLNIDTGTPNGLAFTRRSTVSLHTSLGEFRLGRDYAPTYWNVTHFDPFSRVGVGSFLATDNFGYGTIRNNNSIGYIIPKGNVYGQIQYAFGEKSSAARNSKQGDSLGGRVGYAKGAFNAAVAYARFKQVVGASNIAPITVGKDIIQYNLAASWNFGFIKPMLFWGRERVARGVVGGSQVDSMMISFTAPIFDGEIRGSAAKFNKENGGADYSKFSIGYGYSFSKRTQVYFSLAQIDNNDLAAVAVESNGVSKVIVNPGKKSSGYEFGIRHTF